MKALLKLVLLGLFSAACASTEVRTVEAEGYIHLDSVASLVARSDVVIVGTVRSESGTRNMARQQANPQVEDSNYSVLGQDYQIRVESVLKGAAKLSVTVTVPKGFALRGQSATQNADYLPLRADARYAFLRRQIDGTDGFVGTTEPWRFSLVDLARPESPWSEASHVFQPKSVSFFLTEISAATMQH